MTRLAAAALALVALACTSDPLTVVYVTVEARPAVRPIERLAITLSNSGGTFTQEFELGPGATFPKTFTVTPTGRTGALTIVVEARGGQLPVARGTAVVEIAPDQRVDVPLVLEPDDFVVNEGVVRTQWLTFREELQGRQVAVAPDGRFLMSWENDCPLSRCDILARLFGADTLPATNGTTMTTGEFIVNQTSEYTESPVIAASAQGFFMAWMFEPDMGSLQRDVKATVLTADGAHRSPFDLVVSSDPQGEYSPAALVREDGSYVVMWERDRASPATGREVRARLFAADGTPRMNPVTNDTGDFPVSAATSGDATLPYGAGLVGGGWVVAWAERDPATSVTNIRARVFTPGGTPTTPQDIPITNLGTGTAHLPHVAATLDGGFVVGWQAYGFMDPRLGSQPLYVRRFLGSGMPLSTEIRVADESISFYSAPGLAVRQGDGAIGVAWHDCGERGDGAGCGIRFRLLRPSGMPSGDPVFVNTTTAGDQKSPAIVAFGADAFLLAWTDGSMAPPDTDGSGVRARVIYPSLERRDGQIGARCGGPDDAPCGDGLVCAATPDGAPLCHPACTGACPGGGVCANGMYCSFE